MRIKRLELVGFKSSKDRTVLDFPIGITGIVGPNGCGKSNIVDALRWVLGEQSARHLRGRSMEDVIFAGNQAHGPLGMAEVTIVLDNENGTDFSPPDPEEEESEVVRLLRKVPELQVTRRLYRSGESEYQINGRPCRLRDITELFLGTGVGTKAYSIVEQGRVGQIVNAKPDDLRLFIEEAAGTTLYRSRKVAAERKIERTRDNLLRVSDVVRELERQAGSLRRQARGAVQYQELKAQEDALDRQLTSMRLRATEEQLTEAWRQVADRRGRDHALRLRGQDLAAERDVARANAREAEAALEAARRAVFDARSRLGEAEQQRRHLSERQSELHSVVEEARADLARLEDQHAALQHEASAAAEERAGLASGCEAASQVCQEIAARVRDCDQRYFDWSTETDATRTRLIESLGAGAGLRNERAALERQITAAEDRIQRLKTEGEALAAVRSRLATDLANCQRELDGVLAAVGTAEGDKGQAAADLQRALGARAAAQAEADRWREETASLRSRLESLEELHRSFAGYNDGVRAFMSNGGRERAGAKAVVADVIQIDSGYERAVAAVLGERLQYIVVPSTDAAVEGARYLRESGAGRASFLPVSLRHDAARSVPEDAARLIEHVRIEEGFEPVLQPLLQGVVVVDSLEDARALWVRNGTQATFVTREGEVVEYSGVVTGGSENPLDEGLLLRNSELRTTQEALEVARHNSRLAAEALHAAGEAASRTDGRLSELDRELHRLTVERVRLAGEKQLHEQNTARTEERGRAVQSELDAAARELSAARSRLRDAEAELRRREEEAAALEEQRQLFDSRGKALEAERRELLSELEAARVREAQLRQRLEGVTASASSLMRALEDATGRRDALLRRLERETREIASIAERLRDRGLDLEALQGRAAETTEQLAACEQRGAALRAAMAEIDARWDATARRLEAVRAELGRFELRRKEMELERSALLESANERLGIHAEELLRVAPAEAEPAALAADLEAVRGKIRRLGTVNLGAVIELEEIETRLAELTRQRDDLERSIEDLRGTIARLNRLSRKRFQECFEEVNKIFQVTFPKLFHGGKASLALTDPENLLETGVEIFVQPPGKRLGNLDLLSGGEKALTAISLIFALFLFKPSPFCVLDEVDAPLDEANIGRFTRMVAEMSDRSQFLLITHNKRTMEVCDTLYGVTMPEPGVSRMVSVDLSQAA
ncbi:MAG TPA: chromosome segregation protein SMC [Candidatus Limnocylindrales bacterium]|nr:chromosome segregation protein SMC [Candidatus Limnocylindrales bacterium]